ncbi:MAG: DUF5658 family protein [Candidatus Bathyarchaeia archaeon]|jgi:ABC-type antimicrobial peptide transport system permease subunit
MIKKDLLFFSALVFIGFSDWLTTLIGVSFFGAQESNVLLTGLVNSSMLLFSVVKMCAVVGAGLAFYKAAGFIKGLNSNGTGRFLDVSYSVTFLLLAAVVINNLIVIF